MITIHPIVHDLEKYEKFIANEVLRKGKQKAARPKTKQSKREVTGANLKIFLAL